MTTDSPYLTAKEAAVYLHISYSTFRKLAVHIPRTRTRRYTRDQLDKWATSRRRNIGK